MQTPPRVLTLLLGTLLVLACSKHEQQVAVDSMLHGDHPGTHTSVKEGQGRGLVRAMDTVAKRITLDHGNIPGIMDAMMMEYPIDRTELLRGVNVGDSVSFTLQDRGEGDFVVSAISPIKK